MTSPNQTAQYQAGYSGASPLNGIVLDPLTGIINFTPTIIGNYVINVLIEEFNANDSLVGSIMQDFQIQINNCSNINPLTPSGVINYSGNAALVGPFNLEACYGDSICFDLVFTDSPSDSIFISSNIDLIDDFDLLDLCAVIAKRWASSLNLWIKLSKLSLGFKFKF